MSGMPGGVSTPHAAAERRSSPRVVPACRLASLEWREGGVDRGCLLLLLDVGAGGARALARGAPPEGTAVRLRRGGDGEAGCVEATVVGSQEGDIRGRLAGPELRTIRLAFRRE